MSRSIQNDRPSLSQRITNHYRSLKRRNEIFTVILLWVLLSCGFLFTLFFIADNRYPAKMTSYNQQLYTLQQERTDIQSGKTDVATKSFDTVLQENLDNLKEYPQQKNNYSITIEGTNSNLIINKNNIFVSDNAAMLDGPMKKKIYDLNKLLAASTNGAQLEVVTVRSLPNGEDVESYANKIFNQLGIGNKDENNGILYLIVLDDRKFRLEVGYGLEGLIPDGTADNIINDDTVVDAFKEERYVAGVNQVVDQVFALMNTKTALVDSKINQVKEQQRSTKFSHWGSFILLLFLMITSLFFIIKLIRAKKTVKQAYHMYQEQLSVYSKAIDQNDPKLLREKIKQTDFYYILLSGTFLILSKKGLRRAITRGRLLRNPAAQQKAFGRILIGDTLYSNNGDILTTAYLASNYNSSNWSDDDSSGSGGGSSWGSFGGGSSGGGGASGGW
ncbi:TPM domain-containing protein [Enterococcus quebecensis]|uniref:TPM domain-containing protein n=1 Tax=Enterococcus quebecensis TaxID=903983 RepID=A0A1E5GT17_9ENTE|nr:TPM domain-containing protein [Enterococcus quebecensis]OEG15819.1 hypothetical protein BCR23_06645 [Enterococcus quebecensis]OJG73594.1 hypothetical protein RV12_GL000609 [Enterococcus quebecensis]